jgi:hypothetical protein
LGCSQTIKKKPLGCQSLSFNDSCNFVGGLQLSTSKTAKECYCDSNECNYPSDLFKVLVGGYLVTIVGIAGVVGNCLAIGILVKLKGKSNINFILTGRSFKNNYLSNLLSRIQNF